MSCFYDGSIEEYNTSLSLVCLAVERPLSLVLCNHCLADSKQVELPLENMSKGSLRLFSKLLEEFLVDLPKKDRYLVLVSLLLEVSIVKKGHLGYLC